MFNIIQNIGNVYSCIDNNKAFDTVVNECVDDDTIPDLSYEFFYNHWYKTQRQTNVPCYTYDVAFWHVSYIYGTSQCIGM